MRVFVVALALALAACEGDPLVPLVQLGGVAPKQIELGDKLEIDGAGFPQGRKARVVFEGALHRPAELAEDAAEIDARGEVVAPDRIEIDVTEDFLASFCGAGSSAAHTTFEGSITVVFAAQTPGAPPVAGSLQHATIDAEPTAAGQARYLADAEDGDKLARAAGLRVEGRPAGGLVVTGVEPGSPAAKAGLLPDDVIVSANGVRALGVADLAPPAGLASMPLVVRRGGGAEEVHALPLDGAPLETPRRFAWPAAIVAGVALLLALLAASPGRGVSWLKRRLARRRPPAPGVVAFARATGLATVAALPLLLPAADVSVLALVAFSGALAVALLVGSDRKSSSARAVAAVASRIAPSVVALAFALVVSGSLRADELSAAQGAFPWGFFALRSPAHLALALVFCAFGARRGEGESALLSRAAEAFLAQLVAALAVVVFFGGWRVPHAPPHARGALALAATALFALKVGLLGAGVERVRAALPAQKLGALARSAWLRMVPLAAAAGLGASAWEKHVTSRGLGAATTFGLAALATLAAVQLAWPRPAERAAVDPMS